MPGQVTWDAARTAWANGERGWAAAYTAAAAGEQVLAVLTLGLSHRAQAASTAATGVGQSAGAMRRATFDEAVSALRHPPGVARAGVAAGPINGQVALDVSLQVGANSPTRVGIDYATGEFVVFMEHAPGMYHGHVRAWGELTQRMQAVLRRSGMADGRGHILGGN